ncbi:MAG: insulinase family protein [Lentisphaerota bacterium]
MSLLDSGFELKETRSMPHLQAELKIAEHAKSGARLVHLLTGDEENLFSITFMTPPPDNTGLPHILEHSVLAGSRQFRVRDPFFEMLKMSMATFINAMTYPDHTSYPVASNVRRDLFNLAEVYFDAVFHPLLTENIFRREGYHVLPRESSAPLGALNVNGIVYNEMKGAYSNPEMSLYMKSEHGLFPDTMYGRDAGGDPRSIPDLGYEQFKGFYQRHYHPSNACFFVYGNIPTEDYAAFLNERLQEFSKTKAATVVDRQPRWKEPRTCVDGYPAGMSDALSDKTFMTLNWLTGDALNVRDMLTQHILSLILLGHEAAPLKKALIESKLGQDLILSGLDTVGPELVFRVGLKGSEPERAEAFTRLVLSTLQELAARPLDGGWVDAAFQQATYHFQEISSGYPLMMMSRVLDAWLYGKDPATYLNLNEELQECRKACAADPSVFQRLLHERLLDNPHRLLVVLKPEPGFQKKQQDDFEQRMAELRSRLSDGEVRRLAEETAVLEREQNEGNSPEALASLPQLKVGDLPSAPRNIPTEPLRISDDVVLLHNRVFSNGVNYLHLDFDLEGLSEEDFRHLPLFISAFSKMGAAGMNYEAVARRKSAHTGGIRCSYYFHTQVKSPLHSMKRLRIQMKTLDSQMGEALDILRDLLFELDPSDEQRMKEVITQEYAWNRSRLISNGAQTAGLHAARNHSIECHLAEICNGLPQLRLCERWMKDLESSASALSGRVTRIRNFLLNCGRLTASFTGAEPMMRMTADRLGQWSHALRKEPLSLGRPVDAPLRQPLREGLAAPVDVAHCAMVFPAPHYSDEQEPLVALGAHIVSNDYMLPEIRFKGNAYGAWCSFRSLDGLMAMGSLNDPHIERTLKVFQGATTFARQSPWTQVEIDRAIIALAKHDEKPIRPDEATGTALSRHLTGLTPEIRKWRYQHLVKARAGEVQKAIQSTLDSAQDHAAICILSSRQKLEEASARLEGGPISVEDVLSSS